MHAAAPVAANVSRPKAAVPQSDRTDANHVGIVWLKKRKDFVRTQRGQAWRTPAFVLTARAHEEEPGSPARFGFTVTKRIGNAVRRNRVKRQLREIVRQTAPSLARAGHDYVLIARNRALNHGFAELADDFRAALERVHAKLPQAGRAQAPTEQP